MPSYAYPYDPSGVNPLNLVTDEAVTVTPPTDPVQANFIVPQASPFFDTSLEVWTGPDQTGTQLFEGVDYNLTHYFDEGSQWLGKNMHGSILFLNREYAGVVYLTYQTLGGPFTLANILVVSILTRALYNIHTVTWTQIGGLPANFPPPDHYTDVADLTGAAELLTALNNLVTAVTAAGADVPSLVVAMLAHINSGGHTKDKVGLGNVDNFLTATNLDVDNMTPNRFMTITQFMYAVSRYAPGSLPKMYGIGDCYQTFELDRDPAVALGYGTWSQEATAVVLSPGMDPVNIFKRTA